MTTRRQDRRRAALILAAEITAIVLGGGSLAYFGADIVVRALRMTLFGDFA